MANKYVVKSIEEKLYRGRKQYTVKCEQCGEIFDTMESAAICPVCGAVAEIDPSRG